MPSAPQKRFRAKGRSAETQTTVALSRPAAISLKRRTLAAQTPVSTLGKMLRTTRLPDGQRHVVARSVRSACTSGAVAPTARQLADGVDGGVAERVVAMDVSNTRRVVARRPDGPQVAIDRSGSPTRQVSAPHRVGVGSGT